MARTPTYTRLNPDELADIPVFADAFAAQLRAQGKLLLIEDDRSRKLDSIDPEWVEAADKIILGGKTLKDNHSPIDPTQRRATGVNI